MLGDPNDGNEQHLPDADEVVVVDPAFPHERDSSFNPINDHSY